eukprot:TRINITY_DN21962_c0_g1_i1.p1 TRINITY_DN21962_c0_g1~~TRINITY_DN21962_c0_g1_i1.p1  ORF type:complete len:173 (+),score=44.39 TRINITY_DN21962_c0_g1_i1:40-519(+)
MASPKQTPPRQSKPPKVLKKKVTLAARCGLSMRVAAIKTALKKERINVMGKIPSIVIAGALEFMGKEILELSQTTAAAKKRTTIKTTHITKAIHESDELRRIFKSVNINTGGIPDTDLFPPLSANKQPAKKRAKSKKTKKPKKQKKVTSPSKVTDKSKE